MAASQGRRKERKGKDRRGEDRRGEDRRGEERKAKEGVAPVLKSRDPHLTCPEKNTKPWAATSRRLFCRASLAPMPRGT